MKTLSSLGHTIQKIINNTPLAIAANENTTSVVTNGGNVYQTGLMGGKIQYSFKEVITNENIVGRVIDVKSTDQKDYLLNDLGSVFEYDYNAGECNAVVREVYSPAACGGDKAVKLRSGHAHILILTQNNKVWGVGDNSKYQLVPQGQCRYDCAVEVIITDTNVHDNECCSKFTGSFNQLDCPKIPQCKKCDQVSCLKNDKKNVSMGSLEIDCTLNLPNGQQSGSLFVPINGDINYVGFLCVNECNKASGSLTYTVSNLHIPCGSINGTFVYINNNNKTNVLIKLYNSSLLNIQTDQDSISGTTIIDNIRCNADFELHVVTDNILPNCTVRAITAPTSIITLELPNSTTDLHISCNTEITYRTVTEATKYNIERNIEIECCGIEKCHLPCPPRKEIELPQPCWVNIFAGFDISILVDNCNRLYVLGSIHDIRSNKDLLKRSCLEELLSKTNASISFPANQLNCGVNNIKETCTCVKCKEKPFRTDLGKFGINLNFPNEDECCSKNLGVCDFLKQLQRCNDAPTCDSVCAPCDSYIYLNINGKCDCPCDDDIKPSAIGSVTLWNRNSVCKYVSQCECPDVCCIEADCNSILEYDMNTYCIDSMNISLDKVVKLNFCNGSGPNVDLFLDICNPGGVKFNCCDNKCNVEFTVDECDTGIKCRKCGCEENICGCDDDNEKRTKFALNFGAIFDPVVLTNFKRALGLSTFYPCPKFRNPLKSKLVNTYVKGGDHICFVLPGRKCSGPSIRLAVTPDVPTVFRFNRRVLDVGVGDNSLSVLVGGLACPNEIYALGNNCYGELGLDTNESVVCWKKVDRCVFDCQVHSIFAGKNVTFYVTQSYNVYASGQWKCLVNSAAPVLINSICKTWKIKDMVVTNNQIILLGSDGCIFGLGDNSLGELGLCHLNCVRNPTPLVFFYKMNNNMAKQLKNELSHPLEINQNNNINIKKSCDCNLGSCSGTKSYICNSNCGEKYNNDNIKQSKYNKYPGKNYAVKRYVPNGRCCVSR